MDWVARKYVKHLGATYRVKVFDQMITIERQPNGSNEPFPRPLYPVYENGEWNDQEIYLLINAYEIVQTIPF